jgi:lysozyme
MTNPLVIDVSHWQSTPDFSQVKAGGTIGVILKATEGTTYQDPTLYSRASSALKNGLLISTYHFMRTGSIHKQMDWFLKVVDPVQGELMCLDHEDYGVSINDLCDAVEYLKAERPDVKIAIYSGHVIKEQLGSAHNSILAEHTTLWIAQYTTAPAPSWPSGTWSQWSLWQYTDKGTCSGVDGPVDSNLFNGSVKECKAWLSPAVPMAEELLASAPVPE